MPHVFAVRRAYHLALAGFMRFYRRLENIHRLWYTKNKCRMLCIALAGRLNDVGLRCFLALASLN